MIAIRGKASGERRKFSVAYYFVAAVVAVIVPTLLITWWLASLSAASERAQAERNLQQQASEISTFIDREIINAQNVLIALASSPYLQERNFEAFYRQASQIARQLKTQIVLRDRRFDWQMINTAVPWGEKLVGGIPGAPREAEAELLRTGSPAVSNLFWGPVIKGYVVAVLVPVPVLDNGEVVYILSIGLPAERFLEIIQTTEPQPHGVMSILDRRGVIVARSDRHAAFVGRPVASVSVDQFRQRIARGNVKDRNLEGVLFCWGYVRSDFTGWIVSSGVPESVLQTGSTLTTLRFAGTGSAVLMIAVLGAYMIGSRISQSVGALGIDRKPTLEEFRVLFESAPNGVLVVDDNGHIALLNAQMDRMFGYPREELIGRPVEMLLPERLRTPHAGLRKAFAESPQARPMGADRELFGRRADGSEFPIEIGLNPIAIRTGNLVMATVVDITARKRAAESLAAALAERDELRRRFMQAQEEERLRLAHELHDQTGQRLAVVMLELKGIEPLVNDDGRRRLQLLRSNLEEMGKTLHQVASELRPASIDDLGLASALANYIQDWNEQFDIDADFHCGLAGLDELPDEVRTAIYRIVQEGLTNVAKHAAEATSVSVVLDGSEALLRLTIEDNGGGFDPAADDEKKGKSRRLGLAGMRERLALIGGKLEIESSASAGTTLFARISLDGKD